MTRDELLNDIEEKFTKIKQVFFTDLGEIDFVVNNRERIFELAAKHNVVIYLHKPQKLPSVEIMMKEMQFLIDLSNQVKSPPIKK